MDIHVKNVDEMSWERFKTELERVTGSQHPGIGKALSDALDYYCTNVLQTRARKEWGGGVNKKGFRSKDKLKYLISELIRDLKENHTPEFWDFRIVKRFDIDGCDDITYKYILKKKAIRRILEVVDRHTITNYIHSLAAARFITWDDTVQSWTLLGSYPYGDLNIAAKVLRKRFMREDTPEYEQYTKKVFEGTAEDIFYILPSKSKENEEWSEVQINAENVISPQV